MKHVFDAMTKNKEELEQKILDGEPMIFDHIPISFEEMDESSDIRAYDREHMSG